MDISKYLNKSKSGNELIWQFAYLGSDSSRETKLKELALLAEPENWTSKGSNWKNDILYSYIAHTFNRAAQENKVVIDSDEKYACFNTGLLTKNGEDIVCMFNRYDSSPDYTWHLHGFRKVSDFTFMTNFSETPCLVSYFSDPSKAYYDPNKEVINSTFPLENWM